MKQKRQRRWIILKYGLLYLMVFALVAALIVLRAYHSYAISMRFAEAMFEYSRAFPLLYPGAMQLLLVHIGYNWADSSIPLDRVVIPMHPYSIIYHLQRLWTFVL